MAKVIVHIDLNAFFVRCEEIENPSLEGKPVIIGHSGRGGIVSTCSYAARKFGVKSGMPTYKALLLCPEAIMIHGNYELYRTKSNQFFSFLRKYTSIIEPASIDECYLDMTENFKTKTDPIVFFRKLQNDLFKETGLKCSIGIAPTKFLAKMASDMKKPMGIVIIQRRDVRKMLDPLPIEDFFGIGKKTSPRLRQLGINTIGDLAKRVNGDDEIIKKELGKFYFGIKEWINGYGSDHVDVEPFDPKSIGHSITLPWDSTDIEELKTYLRQLSKEVAENAADSNKIGNSVQLVLKDNDFKVINRSRRLSTYTNKFEDIFYEAQNLLVENYDDRPIRLIGVTLQNLKNPEEIVQQLSIFDNFDEIKEENSTKLLIGELNRRMKKTTFKTAGDYLREKQK